MKSVTYQDLSKIRELLMSFEEPIIKLYIEASKYNRERSYYPHKIMESKYMKVPTSYGFMLSELQEFYFKLIQETEGDIESIDSMSCDNKLLDLIINRILIGEYVIIAKKRDKKDLYDKIIYENDRDKLHNLLENKDVENKILRRIENKEIEGFTDRIKMEVISLYRDFIIPYTKKIQVEYCFK